MTLLLASLAAVISSIVWYLSKTARILHIGTLSLMLWGASLMWLVDAIHEYITLGAAYFTPNAKVMMNDAFLGMSVVVLALVIWFVCVLIHDPMHVIKTRS